MMPRKTWAIRRTDASLKQLSAGDSDLGFRVQDLGFRAVGFGFRVWGVGHTATSKNVDRKLFGVLDNANTGHHGKILLTKEIYLIQTNISFMIRI